IANDLANIGANHRSTLGAQIHCRERQNNRQGQDQIDSSSHQRLPPRLRSSELCHLVINLLRLRWAVGVAQGNRRRGECGGDCYFLHVTCVRADSDLADMKRIILVAAVLSLSAATAVAQKVKVDVDSTANFASFKTFGWDKGMVARNPIMNA